MGLHEYTPGFQFPRGYQVLNPYPVDAWSGPYAHPDGTTTGGITLALQTIPDTVRFLSQEVRILARTGVGGATLSYIYWFRGNTATLEEFSSGAVASTSTTNNFPQGISSAGATFNGQVRIFSGGISASGEVSLGNDLYVTGNQTNYGTFSGFTGIFQKRLTATEGITTAFVYVSQGSTFANRLYVAGDFLADGNINLGNSSTDTVTVPGLVNIGSSNSAIDYLTVKGSQKIEGNLTISSGPNAGGLFVADGITVGVNQSSDLFASIYARQTVFGLNIAPTASQFNAEVAGVTYNRNFVPAGTSNGQGISFAVLSNAFFDSNVFVGPSGGVLRGGTQGVFYVRSGTTFERPVDFSSTVRFNGGATLSSLTVSGLANFNGGIAGTTFTQPVRFSSGISAAGSTFSGNLQVNGGATFTSLVSFTNGITTSSITATSATIGLPYTTAPVTNLTVNGDATIGATLTVNGNFFVQGTVTTVNRTDLSIDDKIITLGRTLGTDALLDGGGLELGSNLRTWKWSQTRGWESSHGVNVASGYTYSVGGTEVIGATRLGSGVVNSSLQSVGTISSGTWQGTVIGMQYGGVGGNINSVQNGGVLYKLAAGVTATSTGTNTQVLSSNGTVPVWVDMTALTGLTAQSVNVSAETASSAIHYLTFVSGTGVRTVLIENSLTEGVTLNPSTGIVYAKQWEGIVDGGTW